jgi:hypothetical protein
MEGFAKQHPKRFKTVEYHEYEWHCHTPHEFWIR